MYNDGQSNKFALEVTEQDGMFSGVCYEEAFAAADGEWITVRGFVDSNIISFVKKYPFLMASHPDGITRLDRTKPHPQIHYRGYYDELKKIYSGEWELFYELPDEENIVEVQTGEWIMRTV